MSEQINKLIEGQIAIAFRCYEQVEGVVMSTGELDGALVSLVGFCERLLQIVQNLQNEIEELKDERAANDRSKNL